MSYSRTVKQQNNSFSLAQSRSYIEPDTIPLPRCPVCGAELSVEEHIYTHHGTDIVVGCVACLDAHDAEEWA